MLIFSSETTLNLKLKDFITQGPLRTRQRQVSKSTWQQPGNNENKVSLSPSHRAQLSNWNPISVPKKPTATWSSKIKKAIKSFNCSSFWMALNSNGITLMTGWCVTSHASRAGSGKLDRATWFDFVATGLIQSSSTKQVITEVESTKQKRGFEHKALMGASVISLKQWPIQKSAGLKFGPFLVVRRSY